MKIFFENTSTGYQANTLYFRNSLTGRRIVLLNDLIRNLENYLITVFDEKFFHIKTEQYTLDASYFYISFGREEDECHFLLLTSEGIEIDE